MTLSRIHVNKDKSVLMAVGKVSRMGIPLIKVLIYTLSFDRLKYELVLKKLITLYWARN